MSLNEFYKSQLLTGEYEINTLKTQRISQLERNQRNHNDNKAKELSAVQKELARAQAALAQANELVADWQSAMEAWKDLAITLREEIKACPNHEAHKFGKDGKQVNERFHKKEDEARVKRKLKPKYT